MADELRRYSMVIGAEMPQLQKDEGFRAEAYVDTEGYLTIGYGTCIAHTGDIAFDPVLSIDKTAAAYLMRVNLTAVMREMDNRWPWYSVQPLHVQMVLLNMAYNLGVPRLSGFKKTLGFIQRGEYFAAGEEMLINSAGDGPSEWYTEVGPRARRLSDRLKI